MQIFKGAACALTLKPLARLRPASLATAAARLAKCLSAEGEALIRRGWNFGHCGGVHVKAVLIEAHRFNWFVWMFHW